MTGTDLFRRTLAFDHGDPDRRDLMEKVWSVTPWMLDVYTGNIDSERYRTIVMWCRDTFGDEAWPIHGRPGEWQTGTATVFGWTWIGFDSEAKMQRFVEAWPPVKEGTPEPAP